MKPTITLQNAKTGATVVVTTHTCSGCRQTFLCPTDAKKFHCQECYTLDDLDDPYVPVGDLAEIGEWLANRTSRDGGGMA